MNLLDLLVKLVSNKRLIITIVFVFTLVSLVVSLLLPKYYKSDAKFIQVTNQQSGFGGLINSLIPVPVSNNKIGAERALIILTSREIQDKVIDRFNFDEVYKQDIQEFIREELTNNTQVEEVREGGLGFNPLIAVQISFWDREPERAQQVVEYYVQLLDSTLVDLNSRLNQQSFELIEDEYQSNLRDMAEAEKALNEFQNEFGVIEVTEQSKVLIQALAELKSKIVELDLQINATRELVSNTAELDNLILLRDSYQKEYDKLIKESDEELKASSDGVYSLKEFPDIILEYGRLFRELEVQNAIFERLYPQYRQQQMFLRDRESGISVIDRPNLPTYKDKPKRAFIVIAGFMLGIFVALFVVFTKELYNKEEKDEGINRLALIRDHLSRW
jgi:uncharacterized protein involved in exopolysaccharide biosynthesis